ITIRQTVTNTLIRPGMCGAAMQCRLTTIQRGNSEIRELHGMLLIHGQQRIMSVVLTGEDQTPMWFRYIGQTPDILSAIPEYSQAVQDNPPVIFFHAARPGLAERQRRWRRHRQFKQRQFRYSRIPTGLILATLLP